jgi:hypothetical protein
MKTFNKKMAETMVKDMSIYELITALDQALSELIRLFNARPDNWESELESVHKSLKIIQEEINNRSDR